MMLLLVLPAIVQAQFNYTINGSTVTISGYTGPGGDVVIPDFIAGLPVTTVRSAAFYDNHNVASITFGTNVITIDDYAIFQCYNLTSVTISASVAVIWDGPFAACPRLVNISVSSSNSVFTSVNQVLFNKSQTSLVQFPGGVGGSYTIPATVNYVGHAAFLGNSLTSLLVDPANTRYTSVNGALLSYGVLISYPGALTGSLVVPWIVDAIGSTALMYAFGVSSVTIGSNVTSIGPGAFHECPSITSISVDAANPYYSSTNGVLFDKNKTLLIQYPLAVGGSYTIPGTVANLAENAFSRALTLTSIVIPDSVTNIGYRNFNECVSRSRVTIGNHDRNIASQAFYHCPALTTVVIPASVTNIGSYAFSNCQKLKSVCFEGKPPANGGSIFYFDTSLSTIFYVSGATGWGSTYDGIATAPCATCIGNLPQLVITRSGTNVIVNWPTNFTGFTLLSTTNLATSTVWITNTPAPVVVSTNNTVTNGISDTQKFYRLIQ